MRVSDLVKYVDAGRSRYGPDDFLMTNGVVVAFDEDKDPIVFFTCRKTAHAYFEADIEVLNESG